MAHRQVVQSKNPIEINRSEVLHWCDTLTVVARAHGPKQSRGDCFVASLLAKTSVLEWTLPHVEKDRELLDALDVEDRVSDEGLGTVGRFAR